MQLNATRAFSESYDDMRRLVAPAAVSLDYYRRNPSGVVLTAEYFRTMSRYLLCNGRPTRIRRRASCICSIKGTAYYTHAGRKR